MFSHPYTAAPAKGARDISRDAQLRQGSEGNRVHCASEALHGVQDRSKLHDRSRRPAALRLRGEEGPIGILQPSRVVNQFGLDCVAPELLVGRSADVLSWVHIMDAFLSDECVSVQCHDHFALAAGELHGVGVLDLPVVEVEPFGSAGSEIADLGSRLC